jgi:L-threonylcarbamoyladenylate synthase
MLPAALLRRVKAHLRSSGVIAYATESCFGFGCNPFDARAVRRVLQLKRRPQSKGLIVIGASKDQLRKLLPPLTEESRARMLSRWPGAHSWLVPAGRKVPRWLRGASSRLALRVPAHAGARALCKQLGMPLVSTSANRASMISIKTYRECVRQFGRSVLVLRGRIGRRKTPSTIQDLLSSAVLRR